MYSGMEDAIWARLRVFLPLADSMNTYQAALASLRQNPRTWLVTGVAGFIGSNLLECLLSLGQAVVGLDNFSTGHPKNVDEALERGGVGARFRMIYGDVRDPAICREACGGVDVVLHHAALGSVPRSIEDPLASHDSNATGTANMLVAARDANVRRFVYASSSAVYGDDAGSPKREERIGNQLSPYAATKLVDEIYAAVFSRVYGFETIGLRYFNVFGKRQDPQGPYAAVIPRWVTALSSNEPCIIMGDGETTRDFVYVEDVVQANLLAATVEDRDATGQVYNVASGERTTLNELYDIIRQKTVERCRVKPLPPVYTEFRAGDIRYSVADVSKITDRLGYSAEHSLEDGIDTALGWYLTTDRTKTPRRLNLHIPGVMAIGPHLET
jgi:UDP-N-acetylglucosamine/UDP-N-acetylgalactosamine 4-epimerase